MALMSMKNVVYNKLARQNSFCFINSISILVVLTDCYRYYSCSCSSYYYCYYYCHYYFYYYCHYNYYFITIIVIIIVFSIINVICFILFHFIFYCSYYYDFCLRFCVTCVSRHCFVFFFVNDPQYILTLLIYFKHIIHVIITIIFFSFNTTSHWGRIQRMNSSGMVYPYPLITLGKP